MSSTEPKNLILRRLPADILQDVLHYSEFVHLDLRETLIEPNVPIAFIDFPESGVMSLLQPMNNGTLIEVANIGYEGMIGVTTLFDIYEIGETAFCQVQGASYRIETGDYIQLVKKYPVFRDICQRYTVTLLDQLARNSGCYRVHPIEQRCARWLLSTHDRCHSNTFVLTQEFLSLMLGVSRTSVNEAAGFLAEANFISYVRGKVTILDRSGLEQASCKCFEDMNAYYKKAMTAPPLAIVA